MTGMAMQCLMPVPEAREPTETREHTDMEEMEGQVHIDIAGRTECIMNITLKAEIWMTS